MWSGPCFLLFLLMAICVNMSLLIRSKMTTDCLSVGDATRLADVCQITEDEVRRTGQALSCMDTHVAKCDLPGKMGKFRSDSELDLPFCISLRMVVG